jgi:hypothetical protein
MEEAVDGDVDFVVMERPRRGAAKRRHEGRRFLGRMTGSTAAHPSSAIAQLAE